MDFLYFYQIRARQAEDYEIATVLHHVSLSDWLLLCHLGKNMDAVVFSEFISKFSEQLTNASNFDSKSNRTPLIEDTMEEAL